jgi:hypothetical protein
MAKTKSKFTSFKDKVAFNSAQQRSKAANYGHLILPKGVTVFKEEPASRVSLDFLPYVVTDANHPDKDEDRDIAIEGSLWYKRPYKLHRSIGAENTSIVCPTSIGKKCPICEHRTKLLNAGTKWDDESVKSLRPSDRSVYLVVPKGNKKFEEKVHLWDISNFLFQKKLDDELEENPDFGNFPSPEDGLTLKIRFSEETFDKNKFADTSRIDFEERDYTYPDDMINTIPSLDEILVIKDRGEIAKMFFESGEASEEEDEEPAGDPEEKPVHTLTRPKGSNGAAKPATTMRRTAAKPEVEEEPAEEDEEPEEKPKTVARPTRSAGTTAAPVRRAASSDKGETCPSGYTFGASCDTKPECEECPVWTDCYAAHDAAAA